MRLPEILIGRMDKWLVICLACLEKNSGKGLRVIKISAQQGFPALRWASLFEPICATSYYPNNNLVNNKDFAYARALPEPKIEFIQLWTIVAVAVDLVHPSSAVAATAEKSRNDRNREGFKIQQRNLEAILANPFFCRKIGDWEKSLGDISYRFHLTLAPSMANRKGVTG